MANKNRKEANAAKKASKLLAVYNGLGFTQQTRLLNLQDVPGAFFSQVVAWTVVASDGCATSSLCPHFVQNTESAVFSA